MRYVGRYRALSGAQAARDIPLVIDDLLALWPDGSLAGLSRDEARRLSWWLSGLTVVADWVGSNPVWFPPRAADLGLPAILCLPRQAAQAVRAAGLYAARPKGGQLFDFPLAPDAGGGA